MKNPYVFFGTLIALFAGGFFLGKYWNTWFPEENVPTPLIDGTICKVDGEDGIVTAGVCVKTGGPRPVNDVQARTPLQNNTTTFLERLANGNTERFSN